MAWPARGQKAPNYWDSQVKAYIDTADATLQTQINDIEASDVETVAGVSPTSGDVEVADLKTALNLPDDTTDELSDIDDELTGRLSDATLSATYASHDTEANRQAVDRLPMSAYSPGTTQITLVDAVAETDGLKWAANPSIVFFDGLFWAFYDGNTVGTEGAAGQKIWAKTSADGITWSAGFNPFRDAGLCTNPISGSTVEWQPCTVVRDDELWVFWRGDAGFVSVRPEGGQWTNYQMEFKDALTMRLSPTITGSPAGGWSRRASFDGETDWFPFPASDMTLLRDGTLAVPFVFTSATLDSAAPATSPNFFRQKKSMHVAYLSADGLTWTLSDPVPPISGSGGYADWEPTVSEAANGDIYLYSRNNLTALSNNHTLLVAVSRNRIAFTNNAYNDLYVPVSRASVKQVSDQRWLMAQCDFPHNDTSSVTTFANSGRKNATLFVSRRGTDDYVPGVGIAGTTVNQSYPQFMVHDDKVYVVTTESLNPRRSLYLITLDAAPLDDDVAYVHPRKYSEFVSGGPDRVTGPPAGLLFSGYQKVTAASALAASTDLAYAAWFTPENPGSQILVDPRPASTGATAIAPVLTESSITLTGLVISHGVTLTDLTPTLLVVSFDTSTGLIRFNVFSGATLTQVDAYVKSLRVTAVPAENDTVTVAGTVYTWKTTPAAGTDVQIGGTALASATNLASTLTANGMSVSSVLSSGRVYTAKADRTTFAISSTGAAVSVDANVPLDSATAAPRFGFKNQSTSTLLGYVGLMHDSRIYRSQLTDANALSIYREWRAALGLADIAGSASAPAAPDLQLTEASTTATFPDIDDLPATATVATESGLSVLTLAGEASAAVELPYDTTTVSIRFKLDHAPASTEKYVIATVGSVSAPVRIYLDASPAGAVYLDTTDCHIDIADVTRWNTIEVTVTAGRVYVGDQAKHVAGPARLYLGSAFPETLLTTSNVTKFDLTNGSVADGRLATQGRLFADQAETISGTWAFSTSPTVPTETPGDASTKAASTAYADAADIVLGATKQPVDADLTDIAALDSTVAGAIASDGAGWIKKTYAQFKTALGLGNVDDTSDAAKPVSTAQAAADALRIPLPTITAIKTSAYTAAAGEYVRADTTSGAFTVTLPTAPADKTVVWAHRIAGTASLTIARGGTTDVLSPASATSVLMTQDSNVTEVTGWIYNSAAAIWYPLGPVTGNLISRFISDAKGDLIVGTANNTVARQAVGANGTRLVPDSAQTTGLAWEAPTSTTAALEAVGNAINTAGKYQGKTVYNTTTKKTVTADGSTAGSVWVDATGATAHTPV